MAWYWWVLIGCGFLYILVGFVILKLTTHELTFSPGAFLFALIWPFVFMRGG